MASHSRHAESETNSNSNPNRRIRRAGFVTTATAVAALALAACAPTGGDGGTPAPSETATTAPAPEFEGATPEDFIIPTGLDAEAVAEAVVAGAFTNWDNAGANESLRDRILASYESPDTILAEVVAENKVVATDTFFVDGWENSESLVSLANASEKSNLGTLQNYQATAWSSDTKPENIEGYRTWQEVTAAREVDDGDGNDSTRKIVIDYTDHANNNKNLGPAPQRAGGTIEIDLVSDGDRERLSDYEVVR